MQEEGPLLLYDGVCALCNGAVRFVLRRDATGVVRFAPLHGDTARAVLSQHPELNAVDSMIWIDPDGAIALRSDAAIAIGRHVGGFWAPAARLARLVPRPLRDGVYDFIARIRYRVFGRYDVCPLPPAESRGRFLA